MRTGLGGQADWTVIVLIRLIFVHIVVFLRPVRASSVSASMIVSRISSPSAIKKEAYRYENAV